MNEKKIAFISYVLNERQYKECVLYINNLFIPQNMEIEIIAIRDTENLAKSYNTALEQTDAKYKVFLHSNTFIINKNFINDVLDIFINHSHVGMVGVIGAKRIPPSGIWWQDIGRVGQVYSTQKGYIEKLKYGQVIEKYEIVEAIDGFIMATQEDIPWKEESFDGLDFYDAAQCREFYKKGLQIVVARQEKPWCIHEEDRVIQRNFEEYRKKFLKEYPEIENRGLYRQEDLFDFDRSEAMRVLVENKSALESDMDLMKESIANRDYGRVAQIACAFARKASINHPGFYVSPEVEKILLMCSENLTKTKYNLKEKGNEKRRVLHVISEGYSIGGHTRLVKSWIKSDSDSIHSLITTWQIGSTPAWLIEEVERSGGWTYSLEAVSEMYVDRAEKLRELAYEWADVIVLHTHMYDPIPIMAFGIDGGPPIVYMNHADHCFWLGASIADLVVDLRPCAQQLTLERRSAAASYILPLPLQAKKEFNKAEVRKKFGIKEDETIIFTIASHYKFRSINSNCYINIIKQIVDKVDNCRVYIIGPVDKGKWHEINVSTGGKIKALGTLTEIEEYYEIADIYLDCFMIASMTSLFDAATYGLSIMKFSNSHCPILTDFDDELKACSYSSVNEIVQEIKTINKNKGKYKSINDSVIKNHIVDTKEKIRNIYDSLGSHKVNMELEISNYTEDNDLFWSLLIKKGYVY